MENRQYDENLERTVLGTLLTVPSDLYQVNDILSPECFINLDNRQIYQAILSIAEKGDSPDLVTVSMMLRESVPTTYIADITQNISFHNLTLFARILAEQLMRRQLNALGVHLSAKAQNEENDIADIISFADNYISNIYNSKVSNVSSLKNAIDGVFKIAEKNAISETIITGTPTGISEFDNKSGGLQKGDLMIIGAESSQGKSSMAISMMKNAAETGAKIAFYSLEMEKEKIAARMMAIESRIPSNEILFSKLNGHQFKQLDISVSSLYDMNVFFDDNSKSNIDNILSSIRSMKMKYDIDGAVIDYIQILNVNMRGINKEQQMADVARRLKNIAKDLGIWIIALSQLNRDMNNPVPNLNRLRDSGQIAEAADIVMFIYRPEIYGRQFPEPFEHIHVENKALIDIAKGRNIGITKFIVSFDPKLTHFSNVHDIIENEYKSNDPF